ncbi:hypothetical protein WDW89_15940 [Deltaproteobacteria bacterium TL4]
MSKKICVFLLSINIGLLSWTSTSLAQSSFFQQESYSFDNELVSGFSEDGRIKILLLTLVPMGMTETASEEILKALYLNLSNTNHFTLVGPSEWSAQIRARNPSMADCNDIACGIDIGKRLNADMVLVGKIRTQTILDDLSEEQEGMVLTVNMVDVITNINIFNDEVQFTDDNMHDALFQLAVRVSESTQLRGHVLSIKEKEISIDLGRAHGLKIGHQLVIYKQSSQTSELDGQPLGLSQVNIAIAQVHRINDHSSEAIVMQSLEDVQSGALIKTFINFAKQIQLISETRRELDSQRRLVPPRRPLQLTPEFLETQNTGKDRWEASLETAKVSKTRWQYATLGAGVATLIILNNNFTPFTEDINRMLPLFAGGATVYCGYNFVQYRNDVNALMAEGRVKGFFSQINYQWNLNLNAVQVALHYKF